MPGAPLFHVQPYSSAGPAGVGGSARVQQGATAGGLSVNTGTNYTFFVWLIIIGVLIPGLLLGGLRVGGFQFVFRGR